MALTLFWLGRIPLTILTTKGTTQYVANKKNVDAVSKPRSEYQTNHVKTHRRLNDSISAGTEQVSVIITMTMMM